MTGECSDPQHLMAIEITIFNTWVHVHAKLIYCLDDSDETREILRKAILACRPDSAQEDGTFIPGGIWRGLTGLHAEQRDYFRELVIAEWERRFGEWPFHTDRALVIPDGFNLEDWQ